jgi:hypothetical protein
LRKPEVTEMSESNSSAAFFNRFVNSSEQKHV